MFVGKETHMLKLRYYPDPILKNLSAPLERAPGKSFLLELYHLMKARKGVGLSAIQVGISERVLALDVGEGPEFYVNPEVVLPEGKKMKEVFGERTLLREGCLSLPGIFEDILRHPKWDVRYRDENFNLVTRETNGLRAHILQHEMEHLDGKLFVDVLRTPKRSAIHAQMMKLKRSGALR